MGETIRLGVNIDHIATLRQQRKTPYPNLVDFAQAAQEAGAEQITLHLREDRRHIQPDDVRALRPIVKTMNLEMAMTQEMLDFALHLRPDWACIVPERRQELTTEGGLDACTHEQALLPIVRQLNAQGINVSLFINADEQQVDVAQRIGARAIEIHTGGYADWWLDYYAQYGQEPDHAVVESYLRPLIKACQQAHNAGMRVHAGHGLTRDNVAPIARLPNMVELNIGHALVCDALVMGWKPAISAMRTAINQATA